MNAEKGARRFGLVGILTVCTIGAAPGVSAGPDPAIFRTLARFSVDNTAMMLSSAVATIEPRRGAPGYSWLRVSFYSFPLTAVDIAGALNGSTESMDRRWNQLAASPAVYRTSYAAIQLSVDRAFRVGQVDMAVPGHTCTIAPFEADVDRFTQTYQADAKQLRLKSVGSYVCDMKLIGQPNQTFSWDIDVKLPVFAKAPAAGK
jgi:hypothetical protein